jgi:hypothetical protein
MSDKDCPFDADYFLRGKENGVSLYENYRYLPELSVPMVKAIVAHCGIRRGDTVLDFGCARGYLVRVFREMGFACEGVDVSPWAIGNADPEAFNYVRCSTVPGGEYDWVVAKDVLEHVEEVGDTACDLRRCARKGVFVVVPLSSSPGRPYVVPEYEKDITHIHRLTLEAWAGMFMRPGWAVTAQYRVPGVKDNYAQHEMGNGFVTARRLT